MPETRVIFYREDDGTVPVLEWLDALVPKARAKCIVKMERLRDLGHELRRPEADYLRDDIYELRIGYHGVHYRILYFLHGRTAAVVSHGLAKERRVPSREIDLAVQRKMRFERNTVRHTYAMEAEHG